MMMFKMRSKKVFAFLWDVDGTIVDSREFAFDVYNDVLKQLGKRTFTSEELRELFSSDYRIHLKRVGINSAREVDFLVDMWNARLVPDKRKFKLYDEVLDILRYLYKRNYKMALVSSSSRFQLQLYFDLFEIGKFFSVTIAREDVDEQKPSAKPILQAAEKLNVSPHDCVVIDDMEDGIKAAKKLGALTIGVTWGFHNHKRISNAKPDFIAETPNELCRIIVEKLKC
jgi:HAD superfamily hydrolase (TIGR01509 family)